jgi:hypothetical protein
VRDARVVAIQNLGQSTGELSARKETVDQLLKAGTRLVDTKLPFLLVRD